MQAKLDQSGPFALSPDDVLYTRTCGYVNEVRPLDEYTTKHTEELHIGGDTGNSHAVLKQSGSYTGFTLQWNITSRAAPEQDPKWQLGEPGTLLTVAIQA